jgi:hypothetical protein
VRGHRGRRRDAPAARFDREDEPCLHPRSETHRWQAVARTNDCIMRPSTGLKGGWLVEPPDHGPASTRPASHTTARREKSARSVRSCVISANAAHTVAPVTVPPNPEQTHRGRPFRQGPPRGIRQSPLRLDTDVVEMQRTFPNCTKWFPFAPRPASSSCTCVARAAGRRRLRHTAPRRESDRHDGRRRCVVRAAGTDSRPHHLMTNAPAAARPPAGRPYASP